MDGDTAGETRGFLCQHGHALPSVVHSPERLRRPQALAVLLACAAVIFRTVSYGELPWIALTLGFTFGFYGLIRKVAPVGSLVGLTVETLLLTAPGIAYLIYLEGCGAGGGVQALALAWDSQYEWRDRPEGQELRLHLLFNRRVRAPATAPLTVPGLPPFQGGVAGYIGYDWGRTLAWGAVIGLGAGLIWGVVDATTYADRNIMAAHDGQSMSLDVAPRDQSGKALFPVVLGRF